MGLLDDAIREHLDLKRRRGADPVEVARLEQEALGPVRREPVAAEPAADEHYDVHVHEDDPREEPPHESAPEAPAPHAAEPHPAEPHAAEPHALQEHLHADDAAHVLAPEERHEPPHGDPLNQPTTEYRVEDHHHDEDEDEDDRHVEPAPHGEQQHAVAPDEDVLEETPEFLQETPEHDRLWFEQRPPRDFDFDG
jgi:hypothetical protein